MKIIWCMAPKTWSMTDRTFCHFGPFFAIFGGNNWKQLKNWKNIWRYYHFTHVYHKWQSYDVWFLTELFVILDFVLPFYPFNNWKNQKFEKRKKNPKDIIILQMCITNDNHMMYGSWNSEHNRQNFLSFWTIFCTFIPPTTWNIKLLKKWKKHLKILSFYACVP